MSLLIAPVATVLVDAAPSVVVPEMLVQVPASRTMYLLDAAGCDQVRCLRLLRTTVSATQFSAVALPPLSSVRGESTGDLHRLVFATASDGYALVGQAYPWTLYKTVDGARTWWRVTIGADQTILGLAVSAQLIYTVTAHCSGVGVCRDYQVNRSALSEEHWTSMTLPHLGTTAVVSSDFNPDISAYGTNVWIDEMRPDGSTIFLSHDEGETYVSSRANKLVSVSVCDLTAFSTTSLWAQCPTGMLVSLLHSSNAGVTWTNTPQKPFAGTGGGSFDPVSATLAYLAYGAQQPLVRFANGHNPVTVAKSVACASKYSSLAYLSFTDELHGLVLCSPDGSWKREELLRTSDGGRHWLHVPDS